MKIACFVLVTLGLAALAVATEDAGYFVPKAFYKLDNEGHKSNVVSINPHQANILRRLRRQSSYSSSSSSSSSSYGNDGGPVYFSSHHVAQGSPSLESRFGGSSDGGYGGGYGGSSGVYGGSSGVYGGPGGTGHAVHTTGIIKDGRVVYEDTKHTKL